MAIENIYHDLATFYNKRDLTFSHLPLAGDPWQMFLLIVTYTCIVLHWGPRFMRSRPPYNLRYVMLVYNGSQVAANLFMAGWTIYHAVLNVGKLHCVPTNADNSFATYVYFLNKCCDLIETVFFVLRKKTAQISFLHVYHHVMVIVCCYMVLCIRPGGHLLFYGFMNCLVHTIMYGYYFMSVYDSALLQRNSWLTKRKVTLIQMTQFVLVIVHFAVPLMFGYCDYPRALTYLVIVQCSMMLILFGRFYQKSYCDRAHLKIT